LRVVFRPLHSDRIGDACEHILTAGNVKPISFIAAPFGS
jgi:hypothetical protein